MKLTIESTDQILEIDGVPVRLWRGRHESGAMVEVYVHRVVVPDRPDQVALLRELIEKPPPRGVGPWAWPRAAEL